MGSIANIIVVDQARAQVDGRAGAWVALRVARLGANGIVHGRNQERGKAVVAEITKAGGTARFYAADLASLAEVRTLAQAVSRDYEQLVRPRQQRRHLADGPEDDRND